MQLSGALFKAIQAHSRFRGDSGLYTWLYRILVNQCKDRQKAKIRASKHFVPMADHVEQTAPSSALGADRQLERKEQSTLVREAIAQLPPKFREILVLRHFEELAYDEIADVLGCPIGTVRSRLSKARDRLRELLAQDQRIRRQTD